MRIDAAEDVTEWHAGDYVGAAHRFVDEASLPGLPFTGITVLLCGITAALAAATALAKRKRARSAAQQPVADS